tara:strand:+ start:101457 stop:102284 length:828 start_codon:yes stop_codon:yes gene_type:complete
MSTKIYEGLRVATPEGQGMLRFRKEVFDTAEPLLRKGYDRMVAMKCVDILDRFMVRGEIPEGLDSEKSDSSVAEVVTKFLLDNAKEMSRELRARDPEHDFTFSLSVYPFDDYTLLFPICEQQDVIEAIGKIQGVEEYGYWNNTDQPDDVTDEEWEERGKIWEEACDMGPLIIRIQQDSFFYGWCQRVIESIPDFDYRLNRIARSIAFDWRLSVLDEPINSSNIIRSFRQVDKWLKTAEGESKLESERQLAHKKMIQNIELDHIMTPLKELKTSSR